MKPLWKGAAKRLAFSLLMAASLAGCAVYSPYPADYYSTYPYTYSSAYPYGYAAPAYSGGPYYVGPPVTFDLWFSGYGHGGHGYHGGRHGGRHGGHHGGSGGRGGRHR